MPRDDYCAAIAAGDVVRLKRLIDDDPTLLDQRTNPSYAPERQLRCTGLHAAIYAGEPDAASLLIEAGIDIEARTVEGRTALHDSIEFGVPAVTEPSSAHQPPSTITVAKPTAIAPRMRGTIIALSEIAWWFARR